MTYQSASPTPDAINGDTLSWNIFQMTFDSGAFAPVVVIRTDSGTPLGQMVCLDLSVTYQLGDIDSTNNLATLCGPAVNAYDPNDKQAIPMGACDAHYILPNQRLTYTVRFQNTGNADAINIHILDTLSPHLDPATVYVLAQSHPGLVTELLQGDVLRFNYEEIYLPDSASDPSGSQGYITFEVFPKAGVPDSSLIENRVGIYFDVNPPVITNTVFHTVMSTIPSLDLSVSQNGNDLVAGAAGATYQWIDCSTGQPIPGAVGQTFSPTANGSYAVEVRQYTCSGTSECMVFNLNATEIAASSGITVFPNPSQGTIRIRSEAPQYGIKLNIRDLRGQTVFTHTIEELSTAQLRLNLPPGIYFLDLEGESVKSRHRLIIE